jgi:hypothetical protein
MGCIERWLARIFHQGHVRVGCDAVRWQGETTLRARAREEEQRGRRTAARLNRACSAWYELDLAFEAKKVSIHAVLRDIGERPGEISGLGLSVQGAALKPSITALPATAEAVLSALPQTMSIKDNSSGQPLRVAKLLRS